MAPKLPAKKRVELLNAVQYRKEPKHKWRVLKQLGNMGGAGNDGIFKVEFVGDPINRVFIEKRCKAEDIRYRLVHTEIALLHQLGDHDNILKMLDHFIDEEKNKASIFMEYCDAGDLHGVVEGVQRYGPVHEMKVWKWFIGLMNALVYCHLGPNPEDKEAVYKKWNHVYHQDIKPSNIFLKTDPKKGEIVAKLADFGYSESTYSKFYSKSYKNKSDIGRSQAWTPGYEAPEYPKLSGASDVWQLTVSITCVCNGIVNPWSRRNERGQKWDDKQPAGRHYSEELNKVLHWCLNRDPKKRPKLMEIASRLKASWSKLSKSLPSDPEPLMLPGKLKEPVASNAAASAPAPRAPNPLLGMGPRRPEPPIHAFSDPEMHRNAGRGDWYDDLPQAQRPPMSLGSIAEVLSGGFAHGRIPHGVPPGYGHGGYPPIFDDEGYLTEYDLGGYPTAFGAASYPPYFGGGHYGFPGWDRY